MTGINDKITILLVSLLFFFTLAGPVSALDFPGYTYDVNKSALENTIVTIEEYDFSFTKIAEHTNSSNASGYFNVTGITNTTSFYKIVIKHFNGSNLDYIGQSLPEFPYQMIEELTFGNPMDFYLKEGGTINITANNGSSPVNFSYMIKDTKLGYPIKENFNSEVPNATIHVPAGRNYSIMIYPNESFPVSYDLNNLSEYDNNYANITFNTSNTLRTVSGYANLSNGISNFSNLNIIAYLMEPGDMVFQDHPLPYNMSAWCQGTCNADSYNASNGSYSITLPGAAMTANILLFATAYNSTTDEYYGAFRNISLNYSNDPVTNFNFTTQQLLGDVTNITLQSADFQGGPGQVNVTTKKLPFQLKNGTSGANITGFAFVELEVDYTAYSGSSFSWMSNVQQSENGSFNIPAISASIDKINVYVQDSAPLKTSLTASQLASWPVVINLSSFSPGDIDEGAFANLAMDMLKSSSACDVPYPLASCSLFGSGQKDIEDFNPFKIVMGGGKISMRMTLLSNNITVHYKNVDMLASGPPDALFDSNSNQSESGSTLEQAWRFGSMGPEIYDEVLIGIPIATNLNTSNISVKLERLFDNNWNEVWNMSLNDSSQIPSDYSDFNLSWFNNVTGMPCSLSDATSNCYVNASDRMVWLRIPHFSGVGPTISSDTVGNITATLNSSNGVAGSSVDMNFTVNDTQNGTFWYNISFPSGFDASGSTVNITINGSADPTNWTKTTGTLHVNVSSNDLSVLANNNTNQSINISNIVVPSGVGTYTINITTNTSVTVPLLYNVTAALNITGYGPASASDTEGDSRTFNITTNQSMNATWYINGTVVQYNTSNTTTASYTNTSAVTGTWNVTVVANNSNGTDSQMWTWTVSAATYAPDITGYGPSSASDTAGDSRTFNVTANQSVNATWYINGTAVHYNVTNITNANYTNASAVEGTWNVTVVVNNTNGTDSQMWTWTVNAAPTYAPDITSYGPSSASDYTANGRTFNITSNQSINATWYIDGVAVHYNTTDLTTASYTNSSAVAGTWNVTVVANNTNGTDSQMWTWTVTPLPVTITIDQPANATTNTTGFFNVSVTLNVSGTATLFWQGANESMNGSGTSYSKNKTGLLSGNYTFKVFATSSEGATNVSELRTVTMNWTTDNSVSSNINSSTFIVNTTIIVTPPSGNVLVTIPNQTNASINGAAISSISTESLAELNSTYVQNKGSSQVFIGENLTLGPAGAIFSPDIQVQFNYTDAQLTAAGVSESNLAVKYYNTSTDEWETMTTFEQNTSGNYIIANVSHFSTFVLMGTTTTTTPSTSSGSGDGTNSQDAVTSEPYENILVQERAEKSLIASTPVTYTYKTADLSIYEVEVTGKINEYDVRLLVEVLKDTSRLVEKPADGTIYKNLNIWSGTKRIKESLIRFKVENSWITGNNFESSDIKMVKWDGYEWKELETTQTEKDGSYTFYEAKSDSFSGFAIIGSKEETVQSVTTGQKEQEVKTPEIKVTAKKVTGEPVEDTPGFGMILLMTALSAVYVLRKRR